MQIEVMLMDNVKKLGKAGEIVKVAPGYARNYLFTKGLAAVATEAAKRRLKKLEAERAARAAEEKKAALEVAKKLEKLEITVSAHTTDGKKLYGSVGISDILLAIEQNRGIKIERSQLEFDDALKEVGVYEPTIDLGHGVKVKFKIRNVHYAKLTIAEDGTVSFATPVAMPGAVSLSLDPNGEPSTFYADGYAYYTISNNMGYEGDLELAMVPEHFRTEILKETLDTNKVLVEDASAQGEKFALLFEFDGDVKKIRHVLYCCTASRPGIESATNEDEIEVKTETLSLKASPLANGYVKARTGDDTTEDVYTNWYKSVYMPDAANASQTDAASAVQGEG